MKKTYLLALLFVLLVKAWGQPQIISPTFPSSIGLFDLFEVSLTLGLSYSNPYDPNLIDIYAIFTAPDNRTYKVNAFYYERYNFYLQDGYEHATIDTSTQTGISWRIRFTPTQTGMWKFIIVAKDSSGISQMPDYGLKIFSFTCTTVDNANGFISKANSRFLKRDIIKNGQRQNHSFFPIGPSIAWYNSLDAVFNEPRGIYFYEDHIDSLYNNANYMRIFINRFQALSLFGPEFTQIENGTPKVYFDSIINQKDSNELDYIVTYALQHNISIMVSFFTSETFKNNNEDQSSPSKWSNNPFHTILGLTNACEFFTNIRAKNITKNLIRYIIARWGYATNIMNWELWNEGDHTLYVCDGYKHIEQDVLEWHNDMANYIQEIDPFDHCISTSLGSINQYPYLYSHVFYKCDFVQQHNYQSIQNAESKHQLSYILYNKTIGSHVSFPSKPFFMGEFGFDQSSPPSYSTKDKYGIDMHNSLWSSLFSSSMGPASFWFWSYLDSEGLYSRFFPILNFCENLPILSETFTAHQTGTQVGHTLVFPNALQTYYILNAAQDTIYGWVQDTAFAYQSLRWLTDSTHYVSTIWGPILRFKDNGVFDPTGYVYTLDQTKKPCPSSNSNTIILPITNQSVGSRYLVNWYDSETGEKISTDYFTYALVQQDVDGNKFVSFSFPSLIRDLQQHRINNLFGDAIFSLTLSNLPSEKNIHETISEKQIH